jgi:hypothetical protein
MTMWQCSWQKIKTGHSKVVLFCNMYIREKSYTENIKNKEGNLFLSPDVKNF